MKPYHYSTDSAIFNFINLLESGYISESRRLAINWIIYSKNDYTKIFLKDFIRSIDNKNYDEAYSVLWNWLANISNFGNERFKSDISIADEFRFKDWLLNKGK
jgi:hypothetical protein